MTATTELEVAERVSTLEQNAIRVMYDLANAEGGDQVRLEMGEPDFDTPEPIVEAALAAARDGATHYTPNAGLPELRSAIAEKSRRDHGLAVEPEAVVATAGATEAVLLALLATAEAGDEIVLPTPSWPQYRLQVRLTGAALVTVPMAPDDGFDLDADRVVNAMGSRTAAVVLNSPSNPTSRVYDRSAVADVVAAAADHGAYVVLDEIYASLDFEGEGRSLAADLDADNVVVVNGCSKQYAMTGWRLGWLSGPDPLVAAAVTLHPGTSTCPASVSQHAGIAALVGPQEPAEAMYEAFRERRDYVVERVASIDGVSCPTPAGGFYAFVDVSALPGTDVEVASRLVTDYGVVTVPGAGFGPGGEGHLRFSFANSLDRLESGFDRFERLVRTELG